MAVKTDPSARGPHWSDGSVGKQRRPLCALAGGRGYCGKPHVRRAMLLARCTSLGGLTQPVKWLDSSAPPSAGGQCLGHVLVPSLGSGFGRHLAPFVLDRWICSHGEEKLHEIYPSLHRGEVQGREAHVARGVHAGPGRYENLHVINAAAPGGDV